LVLLALAALAALAVSVMLPGGDSRRVKARAGMQKLVGYQHTTPAPWPAGNCFSAVPISSWGWYLTQLQNTSWWRKYLPGIGNQTGLEEAWLVVNMHAENFRAVCQQLNLRTVEIE